MKKLIALATLLALVTITGCETFKGIAKDIENTGRNIGETLNRDSK